MQIVIHPKVKKILIILGVLAVLGIGFLAVRPLFANRPGTPAAGIQPDAQAAMDAATAFYTLDYSMPPALWESKVCMLTTEAGCQAIRNFYAPAVQAMAEKNKIQSDCTVVPVRLVADEGKIHTWQVSVTINHPWPGLDTPVQEAFVEVEKVNGIWLMNRILFQQEAGGFVTPTP